MQRRCKFGQNCHKLAQNACTFYHSPSKGNYDEGGSGNNGRNPDHTGIPPRNPRYPKDFRDGKDQSSDRGNHRGNYRGGMNNRNPNHNNNYNPNDESNDYNYSNQGGYGNNRLPNTGQMGGGGQNPKSNYPKMDEFELSFCRAFQLGEQCRFGEGCRKQHKFLADDSLRRLFQTKKVPNHKNAKLTCFKNQGKTFFVLRMGHQIVFFEYDFIQNQIIQSNATWSLPDLNTDYYYYGQKDRFIYYASENKVTSYHDFGIYDLVTQKLLKVDQAHTNKVTGILHFTDNVVFSTSLDGTFKVWAVNNDKLLLDQGAVDKFRTFYSTGPNMQIELLFLDITEFQGVKIISAGTSDNRLLFWIGNQMKYQQVIFDQKYGKIFQVRYASFSGTNVALVMAWSADRTVSAVIALNLVNLQSVLLIQVQADVNNPRQNISNIQVSGNLFFVANSFGMVHVYRFPDFNTKVGVVMHNNRICDILSVEHTNQNNITSRLLFALESSSNYKEGSLAVYLNKN